MNTQYKSKSFFWVILGLGLLTACGKHKKDPPPPPPPPPPVVIKAHSGKFMLTGVYSSNDSSCADLLKDKNIPDIQEVLDCTQENEKFECTSAHDASRVLKGTITIKDKDNAFSLESDKSFNYTPGIGFGKDAKKTTMKIEGTFADNKTATGGKLTQNEEKEVLGKNDQCAIVWKFNLTRIDEAPSMKAPDQPTQKTDKVKDGVDITLNVTDPDSKPEDLKILVIIKEEKDKVKDANALDWKNPEHTLKSGDKHNIAAQATEKKYVVYARGQDEGGSQGLVLEFTVTVDALTVTPPTPAGKLAPEAPIQTVTPTNDGVEVTFQVTDKDSKPEDVTVAYIVKEEKDKVADTATLDWKDSKSLKSGEKYVVAKDTAAKKYVVYARSQDESGNVSSITTFEFTVDALAAPAPANNLVEFKPTDQKFPNGDVVSTITFEGKEVGEWWPIKNGIKLITNETNPDLFKLELVDILKKLNSSVYIVPGGMTSKTGRKLEGKAIVEGKPVLGDGTYPQYGIVILKNGGSGIAFTHKSERVDADATDTEQNEQMDQFFSDNMNPDTTLFYLPVIKRTDPKGEAHVFPDATNVPKIHRALVRRELADKDASGNPKFEFGMIVLAGSDQYLSYPQMVKLFEDKDKQDSGKTTHIYFCDGGPGFGQAAKNVNGNYETTGTRNIDSVTNYMVIY